MNQLFEWVTIRDEKDLPGEKDWYLCLHQGKRMPLMIVPSTGLIVGIDGKGYPMTEISYLRPTTVPVAEKRAVPEGLETGINDSEGNPILWGSIINADGYNSDLESKYFHCVVKDDKGFFGSDIYRDYEPLSFYKTIHVIGHALGYKDLQDWEGNLGQALNQLEGAGYTSQPSALILQQAGEVEQQSKQDNLGQHY